MGMQKNINPGKLIVFEGLDGSGTTTQSVLLTNWLIKQGQFPVCKTQEPTTGPIGAIIRMALSGRLSVEPRTLAALFAADRLDHLFSENGIMSKMKNNTAVIMDRYYLSSWAYQTLSMNQSEKEWLKSLHEPCIMPDITFFLDVPVDICMERITNHRRQQMEIFEKKTLLYRIEKQYETAISLFRHEGENIIIVDGTLPVDQIQQKIILLLQENHLP